MAGGAVLAPSAGAATTFTVNTASDPTGAGCSGAGTCSLRQAINASGTGDTIVVHAGHFVLSQGTALSVSKAVTISGAGARQTIIDANTTSGVFSNRCVATTKSNRKRRACVRTVGAGTIASTGHTGLNKVAFQGRLSAARKLRPGRYVVTIVATASGRSSAAVKLSFTIVKR